MSVPDSVDSGSEIASGQPVNVDSENLRLSITVWEVGGVVVQWLVHG